LSFKVASGYFQELDDRINYVATKVVHLGDQLEGINAPRSRALEAQELMKYFKEFATQLELTSKVFTDPDQVFDHKFTVFSLINLEYILLLYICY
jgi:recyclin-1